MNSRYALLLALMCGLFIYGGSLSAADSNKLEGRTYAFADLSPAVQKGFATTLHGNTAQISKVIKVDVVTTRKNGKTSIPAYAVELPQGGGKVLRVAVNDQGEVLYRDIVKPK